MLKSAHIYVKQILHLLMTFEKSIAGVVDAEELTAFWARGWDYGSHPPDLLK